MQDELYIAFESYLNNEMSTEEKNTFETKLKNDVSFSKNFNDYKETTAFVSHKFSSDRTAFQENLKSIATNSSIEEKPKKSKVIQLKTFIYAVAAVFVLFFGLQLFLNNTPGYEDFDQHENANFVERGDVVKSLKLAQDAFNTKNYKEAIKYFEVVIKEYPRPEVHYFYAISLLEDNQYAKSEFVLNEIIKGNSVYKNTATWYLALSKLKQKDYTSCKSILLQIPNDYEDYEQVKMLLEEL
ncbi:tetratricopeptide repeat protein [Flavobacterium sp.]|uniref:tetratricopeptide repeat protein n=1 Tax=Flavobacterium sp. TaxID=239 RepID=UPI00286D6E6A|nr:tetratricopeptide repeat protein [Flavobacterium sp.]